MTETRPAPTAPPELCPLCEAAPVEVYDPALDCGCCQACSTAQRTEWGIPADATEVLARAHAADPAGWCAACAEGIPPCTCS